MFNEIFHQKFSYFLLVFFYYLSIFKNICVNISISYTEITQHVSNEKKVRLQLLIDSQSDKEIHCNSVSKINNHLVQNIALFSYKIFRNLIVKCQSVSVTT